MSEAAAAATPSRWERFLGDVSAPGERSLVTRVSVLVASLIASIAVMTSGLGLSPVAWIFILLTPVGAWTAHRRRDSPSVLPNLLMTSMAVVATLVVITRNLDVASPAELRAPLAELLIFLEMSRSFVARSLRDLRFTLTASLALIALAGSMAMSMSFVIPLIGWAIAACIVLMAAHRSGLRAMSDGVEGAPTGTDEPVSRPRPRLGVAVTALGLALVAAAGIFLVAPAAKSSRFLAFTARLPNATSVPQLGGLSNPSLGDQNPSGGGGTGGDGTAASFGYFGFAESMDTAVRGRPDDTLVMRVRASAPDFWRGQSFDTWDGRRWTMSDQRTTVIGGQSPIRVRPSTEEPPVSGEEFIQTMHLATPGPNLIFAAYRTEAVYIPQRALFQMSDGTIRTGVELEEGAIYTVVSRRPHVTESTLRSAPDSRNAPPSILARYATPTTSTPMRVADLATRLTADQPTTYDKVRAIEAWMGRNTKYQLDIPPLPEGRDAVEQFLFHDRVGFCEQIASSLVVMLRSQGIPARLTVGFTPGERNPFTGMYEVRADDAHAWAEVYFPGIGWQAFDPTASVPLSGEGQVEQASQGLDDYLRNKLPGLSTPVIMTVVGLSALLLVIMMIRPVRLLMARRRARRGRGWAEVQSERIETLGRRAGRPREPAETLQEYVVALDREIGGDPQLADTVAALQRDAFSDEEPDKDARRHVEELIRSAEETHGRRR